MIAVIDYGAGNVGSVLKAIQHLGYAAQAVEKPELLTSAEKIILPGQGHFGAMMKELDERRMIPALRRMLEAGKAYLGICLGLQALYEASDEAPDVAGLGLLAGRVKRFEGVFKVPHVGWSQIELPRPSSLFEGVDPGSFVYFCHSFYAPVTRESVAVTDYGQRFAAGVEKGSIRAVQFHPEKSGDAGLRVLKNFLDA